MKIKITNLKTIPLVIKLENPIEFSTRFVDKREFTIVQIFTDIGLIGESCVPIGDPISVAAIIERKLKGAGRGLKENAIDVILNPDNNFIIKEGQGALLII